tara:strand:+ start:2833 stop:3000 length:168 start_codon:yes stop_codon:yes gene_type:complete
MLLHELEQAALGANVGAAPFSVVDGIGTVVEGNGNGDGIFVDIEPDKGFDLGGVF